jgi:hypothetical protein
LGNYIGTTLNGLTARANRSNGIVVSATGNVIGGPDLDAANFISGNGRYGVALAGAVATIVQQNRIGLGATGQVAVVNQLGGIHLTGAALRNRIGEPVPGGGNIITVNNSPGVYIQSNLASNNVVRGNQLSNLGASGSTLGIDLNGLGFNGNDPGDPDGGANGLQNTPTLTTASNTPYGTWIEGTFNSRPSTNYVIDFYANAASLFMGQRWIGSTNLTTDGSGNATFNVLTPAIYLIGPYLTATATDAAGNTSEFAFPIIAQISPEFPGQTFTVINTNDSGPGSLRQALLDANAQPAGKDIIEFNIPTPGVQTIRPLSPLPAITGPVVIDGYTQPGASPNTAATGHNGVLLIELDGSGVGGNPGLDLQGGNSTVRGLVINRMLGATNLFASPTGVKLAGAGGNRLEGCFVGTDASGLSWRTNRSIGVFVTGAGNVIGGPSPAQRNIIAGTDIEPIPGFGYRPGYGIYLDYATGTRIENNLIGVAADGYSAIGNATTGIRTSGNYTTNTMVGGTNSGTANVIAYNGIGVEVGGAVLGNSIHSNLEAGINGGEGPALSSAILSNSYLTIQGRVSGLPNLAHRVEFFANEEFDATGYGEGKYFLGWTNAVTDSNGQGSFTATCPAPVSSAPFITATTTDELGRTSAFSARLKVGDVLTNVIVVNVADNVDDGAATTAHTSLREAIFAANNRPGPDEIRFAIGTGPHTIPVPSGLPPVREPTTIDATTQPGYAGQPIIHLDGMNQLSGAFSLSSSNTVRGFAISRFAIGISLGGFGSVIESNYIGTGLSGTNHGLVKQTLGISGGGTNNVIARNLITANIESNIRLCCGLSNRIVGNLLGTDARGVGALSVVYDSTPENPTPPPPPLANIALRSGARNTIIGGSAPAERNLIASKPERCS